jgi:hypothetical protein
MRGMPERRVGFLMPRANGARGKVRGALPRTPARGTPPETPGPFPFRSKFRNGPRRQEFAPPRKNRAPLTAPGRSEEFPERRERGQMQTPNRPRPGQSTASRWSAFGRHNRWSEQLNIIERRIPRHVPSGSCLLETKFTFRLILRLEYAVAGGGGVPNRFGGHDERGDIAVGQTGARQRISGKLRRKSESVVMGEAPTERDENRPPAAPRFFNELRATFGSGPGLRAFPAHAPQNS